MKVFLRNAETSEYLAAESWVIDSALAHDFVTTDQAVQFCRDKNLTNMEVVLRYENPANEIAFPAETGF